MRLTWTTESPRTRALAVFADTVESDPAPPDAVYEADLVITVVSSGKAAVPTSVVSSYAHLQGV